MTDTNEPNEPNESSEEMPADGSAALTLATTEETTIDLAVPVSEPPREGPWRVRNHHRPMLDAPLTDLGNAQRLVEWFGHDLRFARSHGWLVWDDKRWARDETGAVQRRAKATARAMLRQAGRLQDPEAAQRLARHALASQSASRIAAMITLAESEPEVAIKGCMLDTDPWLLNVANGTLDLQTGELRPHQREDLITKLAPVTFDPDAKCPRWQQFLVEVQPDADVRAYLKRRAGYCATGVVRDHVLPIDYGKGRNGKGVFNRALQRVLGEYATTVPTELLMAKQADAHPTERMTLFGCRLAVASETEQNRVLAAATVKHLTGGDPVTGRYMRRDFVTYPPTHKLALMTNNRPVIRETKDAIWDRVHLVPWLMRFVGTKQDQTLDDKLKAEDSGILNWIVEGCLEWQRVGLQPPPSIVAATAQYRVDMDAIGDFITERCVLAPDARVSRSALRSAYDAWCAEVGEQYPLSAKAFAEQLREREIVEISSMREPGRATPTRGWQGLRLRTAADGDVVTYARVDGASGIPPKDPHRTETPEEGTTSSYMTTPSVGRVPGGGDDRDVGGGGGEGQDREVLDL